MSISTFVAILTCCGCCFIPCLCMQVSSIKEGESPKLQLPLLQPEDRDRDEDSESEDEH